MDTKTKRILQLCADNVFWVFLALMIILGLRPGNADDQCRPDGPLTGRMPSRPEARRRAP